MRRVYLNKWHVFISTPDETSISLFCNASLSMPYGTDFIRSFLYFYMSLGLNIVVCLVSSDANVLFGVALKRQQAAEDKIALHLASVESGTALASLPPGRIYGMKVTGPSPGVGPEPDSVVDDHSPIHIDSETSDSLPDCCTATQDSDGNSNVTSQSCGRENEENSSNVSSAGLEMLRKLFPGKKRSVLELVLRRCNHDLLRAVEHCNAIHAQRDRMAGSSANRYETVSSSQEVEARWSAFRPVGPRPLLPTLVMGRVCGSEWLVPLPALPALSGPLLLPLQHTPPACAPDCRQCNSHH